MDVFVALWGRTCGWSVDNGARCGVKRAACKRVVVVDACVGVGVDESGCVGKMA